MDYSVIKEGDLFFLTEKNGDITSNLDKGFGLYTKDTRFLSGLEVLVDGEKPELLTSQADKSYLASIHLMKNVKDTGAIEVERKRFIYNGVLYEKIILINYFLEKRNAELSVSFDGDFQDMFIVRQYREGKVGKKMAPIVGEKEYTIRYQGADQILRETLIKWNRSEQKIDENGTVSFSIEMQTKERQEILLTIAPLINGEGGEPLSYDDAFERLEESYQQWKSETTAVKSDQPLFDSLYERGVQDIKMLMTDVGFGDVPVAGLPWFAVPFGRDSLITSLFMLSLNPYKVKGTLRTLAHFQGTKVDKWRDEQPGKIMHEIRFGELVTTEQSPFSPYFGTIDATPLFLVLISEYYHWTGDLDFVKELLPNIQRALEWIEEFGEEETGFMSYHQEAEKGFPNQGWKDSSNSLVHENGEYAKSPIALSEVQGYVYQAKKTLAPILQLLGETELASKLEDDAAWLKENFEQSFWMEDEQFYAIALDKDKDQVKSVTSNPGHLLFSMLPEKERAEKVADRLIQDDMFNGYGIRTMSVDAAGYYPMSYHNGSVWPHDNGMILLGLSKLGYKRQSEKVISGLLEASKSFEYQRLPELFCGHSAEAGYPVPYPTTCSPQAWSAATSFAFLQSILGVHPNAITKEIHLNPFFTEGMNSLTVDKLFVGSGVLSLQLERNAHTGEINVVVAENTTGYELVVKK
jgi:glycogen debranching enzyme